MLVPPLNASNVTFNLGWSSYDPMSAYVCGITKGPKQSESLVWSHISKPMSSLAPPIATYAICINCVFLHNFVSILCFFSS
jgi:hypothetical protein